jgi:hypothetical protein
VDDPPGVADVCTKCSVRYVAVHVPAAATNTRGLLVDPSDHDAMKWRVVAPVSGFIVTVHCTAGDQLIVRVPVYCPGSHPVPETLHDLSAGAPIVTETELALSRSSATQASMRPRGAPDERKYVDALPPVTQMDVPTAATPATVSESAPAR